MAAGFLLVFLGNHSSKMHHFSVKAWDRQTYKQTDGRMDSSVAQCPCFADTGCPGLFLL